MIRDFRAKVFEPNRITIPKLIAKEFKIKKGDIVLMSISDEDKK